MNCYRIHQKSLNFIYPFKFYSNFTNKNVSWLHFSWATQYSPISYRFRDQGDICQIFPSLVLSVPAEGGYAWKSVTATLPLLHTHTEAVQCTARVSSRGPWKTTSLTNKGSLMAHLGEGRQAPRRPHDACTPV